jgi:hypothetical protein
MAAENTAQRLHRAMAAYERAAAIAAEREGPVPDPGELRGAAMEHVSWSRPLAVVQAEYKASLEHPAPDLKAQQELADELQPLRQARSIMDGHYPGMGMIVTAEG